MPATAATDSDAGARQLKQLLVTNQLPLKLDRRDCGGGRPPSDDPLAALAAAATAHLAEDMLAGP